MGREDIPNLYGLSDDEKWHFDEIIMKYWDARDEHEKRLIELDCYKQFKATGFNTHCIDYLSDNDCEELANELQHFQTVFQKVPHEHEKRLAA